MYELGMIIFVNYKQSPTAIYIVFYSHKIKDGNIFLSLELNTNLRSKAHKETWKE